MRTYLRPTTSNEAPARPRRFLISFAFLLLLQFSLLFAPFVRPLVDRFSQILTYTAAMLIHLFGGHATAQAAVLRSPLTGFAIEMRDGCNAINVMILLWAALLAFPSTWKWKLAGVAIGTMAVQGINFVRFISLFYLGQFRMSWFQFAHEYLWEALIMFEAMVFFGVWVKLGQKRGTTVPHD